MRHKSDKKKTHTEREKEQNRKKTFSIVMHAIIYFIIYAKYANSMFS